MADTTDDKRRITCKDGKLVRRERMEMGRFEEPREDKITVHLFGEALKSRDKFIEGCRNCTCREACNRQ